MSQVAKMESECGQGPSVVQGGAGDVAAAVVSSSSVRGSVAFAA